MEPVEQADTRQVLGHHRGGCGREGQLVTHDECVVDEQDVVLRIAEDCLESLALGLQCPHRFLFGAHHEDDAGHEGRPDDDRKDLLEPVAREAVELVVDERVGHPAADGNSRRCPPAQDASP